MLSKNGGLVAAVVAAWLALPAGAEAGPLAVFTHPYRDCPPRHYCCLHYLTPNLYRISTYAHHPSRYIYAKDTNPDVPLHFQPIPYPCPAVNPTTFETNHYFPDFYFRNIRGQ